MMLQATPIPAQPSELPPKEASTPELVKGTKTPESEVKLKSPSSETPASVLQDLETVERLLITKRLRMKSVLCLKGKKNRFYVRTPDKNLVYTVEEENRLPFGWWVGYLCYGLRPLQLKVTNLLGEEVMRIDRPFALTTRVLPCKLQHLAVYSPPDQLIGTVEQQYSHVKPVYKVLNKDGEHLFWISGPSVTLSCFRDVKFHIQRADGSAVGATCKRWNGLMHALFYSPIVDRQDYALDEAESTFGVAFEKNLNLEEKALLVASTLLIEYMYYDV